jgi:ADP-ribosylglycohydrolase
MAGAAGDALGGGYEFDYPLPLDAPVGMIGGGLGPFEPGEWTDDTSMAIAIAEIAATGADLRAEVAQDRIARRWHSWAASAKDVGMQTRSVLSAAGARGISAQSAREEAAVVHRRTGRSAGNGSLMRTGSVALAYLHDEAALVAAARVVSELTHYDPEAGDACCGAPRSATPC